MFAKKSIGLPSTVTTLLIESIDNRMQLIALEFYEAKQLLLRWLALFAFTLFCYAVLASQLLLLLFWPPYIEKTDFSLCFLLIMAGLLAGAVIGLIFLVRKIQRASFFFETQHQLALDIERLRSIINELQPRRDNE